MLMRQAGVTHSVRMDVECNPYDRFPLPCGWGLLLKHTLDSDSTQALSLIWARG